MYFKFYKKINSKYLDLTKFIMGKEYQIYNDNITNDWYYQVNWSGGFEYNGQEYEVEYDNIIIDTTGNIFGDGSDFVGDFTISGFWDKSGSVKFVKIYTGSHSVFYTGVSEDRINVHGRWKIPGNCEGLFWLNSKASKNIFDCACTKV